MVLLQIALDLLNMKQAIKVAGVAVDYVDIIEAGTPPVKSEGIRAVESLRKNFEKNDFPDIKIMDAGALEARMAFEAGADIVSMCAQAPIETITEAIGETRQWNKKAVVDLIGCRDWVLRAEACVLELMSKLGIDEEEMRKIHANL